MIRPWDGRLKRVISMRHLRPSGLAVVLECGHQKSLSGANGGKQKEPITWAICDECPAPKGLPR